MKSVSLILMALLLIGCSSRNKVSSPFYYEATKDEKVVHILGTMHIRFALEDFHPRIQDELAKAEIICLEVDDSSVNKIRGDFVTAYKEYALENFVKPYPLKEKLSTDAWKNLSYTLAMDEVRRILDRWTIPVPQMEIDPMLAKEVIGDLISREQVYAFPSAVIEKGRDLDLQWMRHDMLSMLDLELLKYARDRGTRVLPLDTYSRDDLFSQEKIEKRGLAFLEAIYGSGPSPAKLFKELKEAYQSGDSARLEKLLATNDTSSLDLVGRNKKWDEKFKWILESRIFVAVGVLHLVGDENFLSLLEKRGYTVRKIGLKD